MKNPLTTLDKKIWEQFEKVTIKANKELGWNKYDLKNITDITASGALTGTGVYNIINGYQLSSGFIMGIGAMIFTFGTLGLKYKKK